MLFFLPQTPKIHLHHAIKKYQHKKAHESIRWTNYMVPRSAVSV